MFLHAQRIGFARRVSRRLADFVREGRSAALAELLGGPTSFEQVALMDRLETHARLLLSGYPEGIYLNPHNPDLTPARRDELLREIRARLEAFPEAHIEVFGPKDLYRGDRFDGSPALFIRVDGMCTRAAHGLQLPPAADPGPTLVLLRLGHAPV